MDLTTNKNFALDTNFSFVIKYRNSAYSCSAVSIPGLSATGAPSGKGKYKVAFPGDTVEYQDLSVTMILLENMENYEEIYNWILNNRDNDTPEYNDISIMIYNSHSKLIKEIKFVDAFPTELSNLDFSLANTEAKALNFNVSFRYTYYTI